MELSYSCKEPKSRDAENKLLPHLTPSFLVLKKKKKREFKSRQADATRSR
jgi:hypothetical protein